ncbi:HD-GYP domain-containing protein [Pseudobacteriovorax antillogorgiicola]|uniref:GAF domain-containing protein n=1 Tax=Pseudobacteriovorax antillogorgiicola TaxID=1513793 RepID=A0A1Y6BAH9_9BACT|nr:HD family phosphohydrolase [Pseudobacteriovorax antillogorgiicola]TCS58538.1 GAF domain-containing protein [Pseudobacteriovorax antillogorgiicola]SME97831.1 GAF domain-containing protein [Pseudobacteriovorax antillogorgiicola]
MSTAKKVVKQEHLDVLKDLDIQTFESLVATISSNEYFQAYEVEYPTDGVLSLSSGPIHLVIVEKSVWNDKQSFRPFFERRQDSHLCICLSFLDNDADVLDLELDSDLHGIGLPVSGIQLAVTIDNHFRLQQAIHSSTTDKEKVAETSEHVKYVLRISRELNGIRDTNKLLSLILLKAREVTNADAGSIYVVERQDGSNDGEIVFKVTQNETVTQALDEFRIPISEGSIVGNAVVKEHSINIPDLYHLDPDPDKNPFKVKHDRTWDEKIGYQCRSMLTLPMFDISHQVIGVIQLINRKKDNIPNLKNLKDFSEFVLPFESASVEYAEIVAQQAGIALENALLTQEKEELFEGFVHASVTAIEQRDPTTSGHSNRVAQLTLGMAQLLNDIDHGKFASIRFDKNQLKEIEYASLLHDFGKLGVREQVLTKAKKLYPWELELVLERFDHIRSRHQIEYLEDTIKYLQDQRAFPPGFGPENLKRSYERKLNELQEFLEFILKSNEPTVLEQGGFEKLKDIANLSFTDCHKKQKPFLKARELEALSVSRGSLTREEFAEIQSHVNHTYEFLRKIPWGRAFSNVPQIAAKHHEKLDGSGYPTSARGGEIPVQTRIMTISDIYDALTASDRPYKKAVPVDRALDILNMEVKAGKLDSDLFNIFLESKVYNSTM